MGDGFDVGRASTATGALSVAGGASGWADGMRMVAGFQSADSFGMAGAIGLSGGATAMDDAGPGSGRSKG